MKIYWRFIIGSTQPKKVNEVINKIIALLGESCSIDKNEVYWKDNSQTELLLSETCLPHIQRELTFLHKISVISNDWKIIIPSNMDETYNDVSGVCDDKIKIKNVSWVSFMIG